MPRATPVFGPTFHGEGAVRSDDITTDPRYGRVEPHYGMPAGHLPVRSYLAVPVISRSGEVLGGMFFGHSEEGVFTENEEQVVEALEIALAADPNPAYLPETLPPALKQVTGRDLQVLDRSVRDVTGAFTKTMVMIRDGDVGRWPGYAAMSYPLLAPSAKVEETRAAIAAADAGEEGEAPAGPKPGWAPPPPPERG